MQQASEAIAERIREAMKKSTLAVDTQVARCAQSANDIALGHLHEQICAEAARLAVQRQGPSPLLEALGDLSLGNLGAMAAEAHYAATLDRQFDEQTDLLTRKSPIFEYKRTLFAAPVGPVSEEAMQQFCDRILKHLHASKCKTVQLRLEHLTLPPFGPSPPWLNLLKAELQTLKVTLRISPNAPR